MAENLLHIHLLGNFSLIDGDALVTAINSPRMQSLLAYLLLHRGTPQPRYQVAFLLWPESSESQARSNLRNLLHRLRHAYPRIEVFLQEDNRELSWRADAPFTFDVADFEMAIVMAKRAEEVGDQDALQKAFEQSVGLYTDDLLTSCYDEWILPHRERLRQAFLEALDQLSILQENQGHYRQAINSVLRLLRCDPLHETIYRRLMQLYALAGDRTGALRVYQTCVTVLRRELGIEPDAATRAVYKSLLVAQTQTTSGGHAKTSSSLPEALTSFIGREREIDEARRLLSSTRFLTLTGPFGSGKTRLGLEVARRLSAEGKFPDGTWWVELASIADPKLVPQAIAAALNIREKQGQTLAQSLIEQLRDRSLLLLLDNCEHLIAACSGLVTSLLRACPRLRILATSREAIGVMGEVTWAVQPLAFPAAADGKEKQGAGSAPVRSTRSDRLDEAGQMLQFESVRLFVERAAAVLPTFQLTDSNALAVARICRRLEGLPLAIELAAARVKMMSVEQIASRLDDALPLLKANLDSDLPHHQTLQAAIDWSYTLLSEKEQALLRRLSVFAGGFSLEAAEKATTFQSDGGPVDFTNYFSPSEVLDLLSNLIDKSLVVVVENKQASEVRYRLLEIVNQYARKRLIEAVELELARHQHADFFLTLVEEAAPNLRGAQQETWLNHLDLENDNLRATLEWSKNLPGGAELGLRFVASLWQYWDVRGYFSEGRQWLDEILAKSPERSIMRAKALKAAGALAWGQGDYIPARALLTESLAIYQEFGDKRDIAAGLLNLGILSNSQGDYSSASPLFQQSLAIFREMGHQQGIAFVLNSLGVWASNQGEYASARTYLEESLALRREMGDKRGVAIGLGNLGVVAWRQGDCLGARPLLQESLDLYQEVGDKRGAGESLNELGRVAQQLGELDLAHALYNESLAIWQEVGNKEGTAVFLEGSAGLACSWCNQALAARLLSAAEALRERIGSPLAPADRIDQARILDSVRAVLTEDQLAVLWAEGRRISLEKAVDLAVSMQPLPDFTGTP